MELVYAIVFLGAFVFLLALYILLHLVFWIWGKVDLLAFYIHKLVNRAFKYIS